MEVGIKPIKIVDFTAEPVNKTVYKVIKYKNKRGTKIKRRIPIGSVFYYMSYNIDILCEGDVNYGDVIADDNGVLYCCVGDNLIRNAKIELGDKYIFPKELKCISRMFSEY